MEKSREKQLLEFAAVTAGAGFLLWLNSVLMVPRPPGGDALCYIEMVAGNFDIANSVAKIRVLTPVMARIISIILGIAPQNGLATVNFAAMFATGICFYYFLRDIGFSRPYRILGSILLMENTIFIYFTWNPLLTDPVALLLLLLSIWAIIKNNSKLYIALLVLAALNKEVYSLFTLPAYYAWNLKTGKFFDWKLIGRTLLLSLIPIAVLTFLSYSGIMPDTNAIQGESAGIWSVRITGLSPSKIIEHGTVRRSFGFRKVDGLTRLIYGGFGVLWIMSFLGWSIVRREERYASRMWLPFILLIPLPWYLTPGRLTATMFPFVIPFALYELRFLSKSISSKWRIPGAIGILLFYRIYGTFDVKFKGLSAWSDVIGVRIFANSYYPVAMAAISAVAVLLLHINGLILRRAKVSGE